MKKTILLLILLSFSGTSVTAGEVIHLPDYSMKLSVATTASRDAIWSLWEDVENWKTFDERLQYSYLEQGDSCLLYTSDAADE